MDWIERWFGLNPDGGNGTIEAAIIAAVVIIGASIVSLASRRVRSHGVSVLREIVRRLTTVR
jgi:hypothetical protein